MSKLSNNLILFTEKVVNKHINNRANKKEKNKNIHPVWEWISAFIWAAFFVLFVNQYLMQAYIIPSRSMDSTLQTKDRLLFNKFIYGPELVPGYFKLPGIKTPNYKDIIIFENPEYNNKGPFFDLTQRLLFMLTLSIVDIDKNDDGTPAHHFLIKRAIGLGGEKVKNINGNFYFKLPDSNEYIEESEYQKLTNNNYPVFKTLDNDFYNSLELLIKNNMYSGNNNITSEYYEDLYFSRENNYKYLSQVSPSGISEYYQDYIKLHSGIYIPKDFFLPLGDNRDNSTDGRYFGIIHKSEILGKASFIFWPFERLGSVK